MTSKWVPMEEHAVVVYKPEMEMLIMWEDDGEYENFDDWEYKYSNFFSSLEIICLHVFLSKKGLWVPGKYAFQAYLNGESEQVFITDQNPARAIMDYLVDDLSGKKIVAYIKREIITMLVLIISDGVETIEYHLY